MRLSAIFASFAFALFAVNARMLHKRSVTPSAQQLIDDMGKTTSQCTVAANTVASYSASKGYAGALAIQAQDNAIDSDLSTCLTDCTAIAATMSDEDTIAVIAAFSPLSTQFANLVDAIRDKKSVFDSVTLVTSLVKNGLLEFCPRFETLATCLVNICPNDYAEEMEETIYIGENACNVVVPLFN